MLRRIKKGKRESSFATLRWTRKCKGLIPGQTETEVEEPEVRIAVVPTGHTAVPIAPLPIPALTKKQLGNKLSLSKQAAQAIENREKEGSLTLKAFREAANALDMQLVYGFVPKDGSIDALIDREARELATQIVLRTSQTMKLEDQENSPERIKKAMLIFYEQNNIRAFKKIFKEQFAFAVGTYF
ncbi:MAG: hypothetical protein IPJ40_14370 [Saprospirales bacterium]|nr:hypothetical protein [Saprospirales bacterium]